MNRPDPYDLAQYAEHLCLAESPDGYLCGEEPGHQGWHRAKASEPTELLDTWPGET